MVSWVTFPKARHVAADQTLSVHSVLMSESTPSLESTDQRVSYGIALNMGGNIARQGGVEIGAGEFSFGGDQVAPLSLLTLW